MRGFAFTPDDGRLTFGDADRNALVVPDAFPVLLLPDELVLDDIDAVFPDVPKSRATMWQMSASSNSLAQQWGVTEVARCHVTATPQLWSSVTALADAPDDADVFALLAKLTRTVAPSSGWPAGIAVATKQDAWLPLTGSVLLEVGLGFARAMSIYIDGDDESPTYRKLVLHQQQSVSVSPGGYGVYGNPNLVQFQNTSGGDTVGSGYPVYYGGDSAPQYRTSSYIVDYPVFPMGVDWTIRHHPTIGTNPPSSSDPTDFGATWRIDLRGQFGRRS